MPHLEDLTVIELLRGEDDPDAQRHLDGCARCRETHRLWARLVEGLRELGQERVDHGELHRLKVLYRQLGPANRKRSSWEARPARSGSPATCAIRGEGDLVELTAGPCTVVMQAETKRSGMTSLHGQLLCEQQGVASGGRAVFVSEDGDGYVTEIDAFGEFHLDRLPVGRYRALWQVAGASVTLQSLQVGKRGDN